MLLYYAICYCQPQSRSFAQHFGGKEGFEYPVLCLFLHPYACIGYCYHNVHPWASEPVLLMEVITYFY